MKASEFAYTRLVLVLIATLFPWISASAQSVLLPTFVDSVASGAMMGYRVVQSAPGKIFVFGKRSLSNSDSSEVYVLDTSRIVLHTHAFALDSQTLPVPRFMQPAANGSVFACYSYPVNNIPRSCLIYHDSTGLPLWAREYPSQWIEMAGGIDRGIVFAYHNGTAPCVARVDSMGNLIWGKALPVPAGYSNQFIYHIDAHPVSGEITITGGVAESSTGTIYANVIRLDANGTVLWSKRYNSATASLIMRSVFSGETYLFGVSGTTIHATCIDYSGNVLWTKIYSAFASVNIPIAISEGQDGNVYMYSYFSGAPPVVFQYIMCIDKPTGNMLSVQRSRYNYYTFSAPLGIQQGRYAFAGTRFMLTNDMFEPGCGQNLTGTIQVTNGPAVIATTYAAYVTAYMPVSWPATVVDYGSQVTALAFHRLCNNPVGVTESSDLQVNVDIRATGDGIQISGQANDVLNYQVYDVTGRVIAHGFSSGITLIQMNGQSSGIYVVAVTDSRGRAVHKKVVFMSGS